MPFAKSVDGNGGVAFNLIPGSSPLEEFKVVFEGGAEVGFGQSSGTPTTSPHTYIRLTRADGSSVYLSVDAGTTIDVATSRPASV